MRLAIFSSALMVVLGLFVVGCSSNGSSMKSDKSMSMDDRSADKIVVTTGRGEVTYGWDKKAGKPVASTANAGSCEMCSKAIAGYYSHGTTPPAQCPTCSAKIKVVKGAHGTM